MYLSDVLGENAITRPRIKNNLSKISQNRSCLSVDGNRRRVKRPEKGKSVGCQDRGVTYISGDPGFIDTS